MRRDPQLAEHGVIGLHGVGRPDLAVNDQAKEVDEGKLVLGMVDLATEESHAGAIFLGVGQKLKRVSGGPGRSAQDADDQVRVEPDKLFHGFGPMVNHLEEERPARRGNAGEHPGDHVVDIARQDVGRDGRGDVGVENLEEVAKLLALGLFTKLMKSLERREVGLKVVVEGHAVETEVRANGPLLGAQSRCPHWM